MVDIDTLIGYFNKLQRIILCNADFGFGSKKFLKKEKPNRSPTTWNEP